MLAAWACYLYSAFRKRTRSLIDAGERVKENFNNYEVNNYIYKLDEQKRLNKSRAIEDSVTEVYEMVSSSSRIDIYLKEEMRSVLRSKGLYVK